MDTNEPKNAGNVSWWITSLAISVTCCAVLFVIFANYFVTINKSLADANIRLTAMEADESQLLVEVQSLHHVITANATAASAPAAAPAMMAPAPAAVMAPAPTMAPAATPAPTAPAKK
jgi:hypothetical protein